MKNADREHTIAAMNEWMQEKDVAALYSSRERTEDELRTYELMDKALALLEAQEWVSTKDKQPEIAQKCIVAHPIPAIDGWSVICCEYLEFGFPLAVFGDKDPALYWFPIPPLPTPPSEEG